MNWPGDCWAASGLYGWLHTEQTSLLEKGWNGSSVKDVIYQESKLTVTCLVLGRNVWRKKKVVGPMRGGSR